MARRSTDKSRRSLRLLLAGETHLSATEYATLLGLTVLVALITVMMIGESVGQSLRRSAARPSKGGDVIQPIPHEALDHAP